VIVDSLAAYAEHVADENNAASWTRELKGIVEVARSTNVAMVILHHASKGTGAYRGSTAIGANVDTIIEMADCKRDASVRQLKIRGRLDFDSFDVRYDREAKAFSLAGGPGTVAGTDRRLPDMTEERVMKFLRNNPGAKKVDIRMGVGGRGIRVDEAV